MWSMPCPKQMGSMMLGQKDAWTDRLHLSAKQNIEPGHIDIWAHGWLCPVGGTEAARGRPYLHWNKKSQSREEISPWPGEGSTQLSMGRAAVGGRQLSCPPRRLGNPLRKPERIIISWGFAALLCWMSPRAGVSNGLGYWQQGVMRSAGAGADGSQRLAGPPAAPRHPGYCSYHAQGAPCYAPNKSMWVLFVFFCQIIHSKYHFVFLLPRDSLWASPCFEKSGCYSQVLIIRYSLGGICLQTVHCNY